MDDKGDFVSAAAREIEEEVGIKVTEDNLVYLDEFATSCGGSDERIKLYCCEIDMPEDEIKNLHGKITGLEHEHEMLKVIIIPLDDLPKHTRDPKSILAYCKYKKLI